MTLNEESQGLEKIVADLATSICKRGLASPAVFLLEMHKPLTGVAAGVAHISRPLLNLLAGHKMIEAASQLLESSEHIEMLIKSIEEKQRTPRATQ